jgi:hypothetical protein
MMRNIVEVNRREVACLDRTSAATTEQLAKTDARLEALGRPRWFRRPDQDAIDDTIKELSAQKSQLDRLQKEGFRQVDRLQGSERRLGDVERAVARIPELEAAITRRGNWLRNHPAEVAWEADLATRLADTGMGANASIPDPEPSASGLDSALEQIDLRTIDLSPARPRAGIERRLGDALGITRPDDPIERLLRPPPGRDSDGPDLGLGLGL